MFSSISDQTNMPKYGMRTIVATTMYVVHVGYGKMEGSPIKGK